MDPLDTPRFAFADVTNTQSLSGDDEGHVSNGKLSVADCTETETRIIKSIVEDDKSSFLALLRFLNNNNDGEDCSLERTLVSKYLHLCCAFDSIDCATALVNGEVGAVPLLNEVTESSGMSPLHEAAKAQSARCLGMLLRKRARTDLKTKDGRRMLPLELSLSCAAMDVTWEPGENSVEDLVVQLSEKDLTAVKLLSEKTKEVDKIASARAAAGRVVELAALLIVAAEKVNESVLSLDDAALDSQEKTTLYEYVVKKAVALGRATATAPTSLGSAQRYSVASESECVEKRRLMLCQIELLQLFGAVAQTDSTDCKKVASPLIHACQAGDETVTELLLSGNVDINDVDADGNSALHWCLKTSKGSSPQINIMWLLLSHGARVCQKNKLGQTAVHIAAANGNSQALEVLLLGEPDCINFKTEMKETPLFFAVKNNCIDCAELLLRWGASTDVFNLRKQRPLDLAESQDMRFLLNDTSIRQTNRAVPVKKKYTIRPQGDDVISETCEEFLILTDEGSETDSKTSSSTKADICKYFESPYGCFRGDKCFFSHADVEHRKIRQRKDTVCSPSARDYDRKIFVGGLPSAVDSASLRTLFEERFGSVDEAMVVGVQEGSNIHSRGFGFVTFKHKKSVLAAVEAHYVTIMGKQVEVKSAVPRFILQAEFHKSSRQCEEDSDQYMAQAQTPKQKNTEEVNGCPTPIENSEVALDGCKTREEAKPELKSWVDRLVHGQQKACSDVCKAQYIRSPAWLRILKKWLPHFIKQVTKRDGEYALSSLKSDFRATFRLELDHASLGFSKLSDFMRTLPDLCQIKHVPTNHMILLPCIPGPYQPSLQPDKVCSPPSHATSIDSGECDSSDAKCFREAPVVTNENEDSSQGSNMVSHNETPEDVPARVHSRFLQFLDPDPIFHARPWLCHQCGGCTVNNADERPQRRHKILEALARRKNNSSVFFLREFDFYDIYKATIIQGRCFACNQRRVLWANFPCLHLLWCADCKPPTTVSDGNCEHKCVLCDMRVQKIDLISWHDYCRPILDYAYVFEFPRLDSDYLRK